MNKTREAVMRVFDDDTITFVVSNEDTTVSMATDEQRSDFVDSIVRTLINEIEAAKGRIRIEYDDLKTDYHSGQYRAIYTKRQCEDHLFKLNGEVLGMESALSTLYRAIDTSDDK